MSKIGIGFFVLIISILVLRSAVHNSTLQNDITGKVVNNIDQYEKQEQYSTQSIPTPTYSSIEPSFTTTSSILLLTTTTTLSYTSSTSSTSSSTTSSTLSSTTSSYTSSTSSTSSSTTSSTLSSTTSSTTTTLSTSSASSTFSTSSTTTTITKIPCIDSDDGKEYYTKGYITHSDGTKEYDECDTKNIGYETYVIEYYCTEDGVGSTAYKCPYGCSDGKCTSESSTITITVSQVLDGDTIKLENDEIVRLIGINAPETEEQCSEEAKNALKDLVEGKEVRLESDVENKDHYSRLLRYVFINYKGLELFVNSWLVSGGYAIPYSIDPNTKHKKEFDYNEDMARKNNEGCLWKASQKNYIQDQCIYITNFHFNAAGNDNYNLNDEYVTFRNKCSYVIDMTGWTVKDETASHIYTFPSFALQAGANFTLYTGTGKNTNSALYWGRTSGKYAAIWNNDGDTIFLRDSNGDLVLTQSYSGY